MSLISVTYRNCEGEKIDCAVIRLEKFVKAVNLGGRNLDWIKICEEDFRLSH